MVTKSGYVDVEFEGGPLDGQALQVRCDESGVPQDVFATDGRSPLAPFRYEESAPEPTKVVYTARPRPDGYVGSQWIMRLR